MVPEECTWTGRSFVPAHALAERSHRMARIASVSRAEQNRKRGVFSTFPYPCRGTHCRMRAVFSYTRLALERASARTSLFLSAFSDRAVRFSWSMGLLRLLSVQS